jgi:hypothetical protein
VPQRQRNRARPGGVLGLKPAKPERTVVNRAFGVTVTLPPLGSAKPQVQPWVVVARDADDAALVAVRACCSAAAIDAETFRELSDDEIREHALDLANHGMAKALPTLDL